MHVLSGAMTHEEAAVYADETHGMLAAAPVATPLVAIELDVDDATLSRRIGRRDRDGEAAFYLVGDPQYIPRLRVAYAETVTSEQIGCAVVRVPWNDDAPELALTDLDCERLLTRVMAEAMAATTRTTTHANCDDVY